MKLRLPKAFLAALMLSCAAVPATTYAEGNVISVNFGTTQKALSTSATGELNGVGAAGWQNIVGSQADVSKTHALVQDGQTLGYLQVSAPQALWGPDNAQTGTLVNEIQYSYLDLSANNTWTIVFNGGDYMVYDAYFYLAGDNNKYSPVEVNGLLYEGDTVVETATASGWGNRGPNKTTFTTDDNLVVCSVTGTMTAKNHAMGNSNKRATLGGLQIVDTTADHLYTLALNGGEADANAVTWIKPTGNAQLANIATADRYLGTAGTGTLAFGDGGVAVQGLQAAEGTLTVTGTNLGIGTLHAKNGAVLDMQGVFAEGSKVNITGFGKVMLTEAARASATKVTVGGSLQFSDITNISASALSNVTFVGGGTLVLGNGQTLASAPVRTDNNNTEMCLKVEDGATAVYATQITSGRGITQVEIGKGATLDATVSSDSQFGIFYRHQGSQTTIHLKEGATLNSRVSVNGWDRFNDASNGRHTILLETGSAWNISAVSEYMNNSTIKMYGASINLAANSQLHFERFNSYVIAEAESTRMNVISGGQLRFGNNTWNDVQMEVWRGAFDIDSTNTADLSISSLCTNGNNNETNRTLYKSKDGVLELTNSGNTYTGGTVVQGGTLKLGGTGGKAGTGTITVNAGATLELAHTQACTTTNAITLNGNLVSSGVDEVVNAALTLTANHTLTVNGGSKLTLAGAFTNNGAVSVSSGGELILNSSYTAADTATVNVTGGTLRLNSTNADGQYVLTGQGNTTFGTGSALVFGANYGQGATISLVDSTWTWDALQPYINNGLYGGATASYDAGTNLITISATGLVWAGANGDVWNDVGANTCWSSGATGDDTRYAFTQGRDTVFNTANASVAVTGTSVTPIEANSIAINAATTFSGGYVATKSVTQTANLILSGNTLEVQDSFTRTGGTLNLAAGGMLKLATGGTVNLTMAGGANNTGTLEVTAGTTANLGNVSAQDINFRLAGDGKVCITGANKTFASLNNAFTGTLEINLANFLYIGDTTAGHQTFMAVDGKYADIVLTGGGANNSEPYGLVLNTAYAIGTDGSLANAMNIGSLSSTSTLAVIRGDVNAGTARKRYISLHQDTTTEFAGRFLNTNGGNTATGLIMNGVGTIKLTNANTSTAMLVANSGTIELAGNGEWVGQIIVKDGGQLYVDRTGGATGANTITLAGQGVGAHAHEDGDMHDARLGALKLANGASVGNAISIDATVGASIFTDTLATGTLTGAISGGTLTKQGEGTLVFNHGSATTIANNIVIEDGTLRLAGTETLNGSLSGPGSLEVTGTVTLNGLYALGAEKFSLGEGASLTFGADARISKAGLTLVAGEDQDVTTDGFLANRQYAFATAGTAVTLTDGRVMMQDASGRDDVYATYDQESGRLLLNGTVYNLVTTKTLAEIRNQADSEGHDLTRILLQDGSKLQVRSDSEIMAGTIPTISGSSTVELAWEGRKGANNSVLENALKSFTGELVVAEGASWIFAATSDHKFSNVTVQDGGQFVLDNNYTGNVTISGGGVTTTGADAGWKGALQLAENKTLTGDVNIAGASATISTLADQAATIVGDIIGDSTMPNGSTLSLISTTGGANALTVNGNLTNLNTVNVATGTLTVNKDVQGNGSFTKTGSGKLVVSGNIGGVDAIDIQGGNVELTGALSDNGSGKITFTGAADGKVTGCGYHADGTGSQVLVLKGTQTTDSPYSGELVIDHGTVSFGAAKSDPAGSLSINQITVNNGGVFRIRNSGSDSSSTNFKLNAGGLIYLHDSDASANVHRFGRVTMGGNAGMEVMWKGVMRFSELTGAGNLAVSYGNNGNTTDTSNIIIDRIVNYTGTISHSSTNADYRTLTIGNVHQDSGYSAVIGGAGQKGILSSDFHKTGAGSLDIQVAMEVNGDLYMNYSGDLSIGTDFAGLSVVGNTRLHYTNETGLIHLGTVTNSAMLYIDLSGVSQETMAASRRGEGAVGINLGIKSSAVELSSLKVLGLLSDEYVLVKGEDYYYFYLNTGFASGWDTGWGPIVCATAPDTAAAGVKHKTLTDGNYVLEVEGSDTTALVVLENSTGSYNVFGGATGATTTLEGGSWIQVKSGTYGIIAGGSHATWGDANSPKSDFVGDSHIQMDGGTANHIIGGTYQDGHGTAFTGSSYISVMNGQVAGGIIGASTAAHDAASTFTGDTHIIIHNVQNTAGAALDGSSINAVVGGRVHATNVSKRNRVQKVDGSTYIDILSQVEEGSGVTNFTKDIIGGNYGGIGGANMDGCNFQLTGSTNINIAAGEDVVFTGLVAAGSRMQHTAGKASNTESIGGATNLTISSGKFANIVIGGSYIDHNGTSTITGGSNITITGGTFTDTVAGGSATKAGNNGEVAITMGNSSINISNATLADVVGGSLLYGSTTAASTVKHGDISLTLKSGSVANIYGGSDNTESNSSISHGAIVLDLQGGSISGDVYAAGKQGKASAAMTTPSTTVKLTKDVQFTGANQTVSGGYAGNPGVDCTVLSRTLELAAGEYTTLDGVTFKDFDTISNAGDVTLTNVRADANLSTSGKGTLTITNLTMGNAWDTSVHQLNNYHSSDLTIGTLAMNGSTEVVGANNVDITTAIVGEGPQSPTLIMSGTGTLNIAHTAGGTMQGGELIINNGTVALAASEDGVAVLKGTAVNVNAGGTLRIDHDSLGKGGADNRTASIALAGADQEHRAVLVSTDTTAGGNTIGSDILMGGYASLEGEGDGCAIKANGMGISAEGVGNSVSADVNLAKDLVVSVENTASNPESELAVSGNLQGSEGLYKMGEGTLTLSGADNTYSGITNVSAGTLEVTGSIKNTAALSVSGSGALYISGEGASVTAGGTKLTANGDVGVLKNVTTLDGGNIIGAYSGVESERNLKALGEMSSLSLEAAASMRVENVVMQDVAIGLKSGVDDVTITYANATAIGSSASVSAPGSGAVQAREGEELSGNQNRTLTTVDTTVQTGGKATGTLTVDIANSLIIDSRGSDLTWTILSGVDLTDFKLAFDGELLKMIEQGIPEVKLTATNAADVTQEWIVDSTNYKKFTTDANFANFGTGVTLVLDITNVPEPTTGVLSVLALAGLAARRRRKA